MLKHRLSLKAFLALSLISPWLMTPTRLAAQGSTVCLDTLRLALADDLSTPGLGYQYLPLRDSTLTASYHGIGTVFFSAGPLELTGVLVHGRMNTSMSTAQVVVEVYPLQTPLILPSDTVLARDTLEFSGTADQVLRAHFDSTVALSGDFFVALKLDSANLSAPFELKANNIFTGLVFNDQTRFITPAGLATGAFLQTPNGTFGDEVYIEPIVSFTPTLATTPDETPCDSFQVAVTRQRNGYFNNPLVNPNGTSGYTWGDGSGNQTGPGQAYTYPQAGTYTYIAYDTLRNLTGSTCVVTDTQLITVPHAIPDVRFSLVNPADTQACDGDLVALQLTGYSPADWPSGRLGGPLFDEFDGAFPSYRTDTTIGFLTGDRFIARLDDSASKCSRYLPVVTITRLAAPLIEVLPPEGERTVCEAGDTLELVATPATLTNVRWHDGTQGPRLQVPGADDATAIRMAWAHSPDSVNAAGCAAFSGWVTVEHRSPLPQNFVRVVVRDFGLRAIVPFVSMGYEVQWLDANLSPLPGETGDTLLLDSAGTFYLRVGDGRDGSPSVCYTLSDSAVFQPIGLAEDPPLAALRVYPNPTAGTLQLAGLPTGQTAEVTLLDLQGRVVHRAYRQNQVPFVLPDHLTNGLYLLRVRTEAAAHSLRVLLQR